MADETIKKIVEIQVEYKDAIKGISDYNVKISEANELQKKLKEELKKGSVTQKTYEQDMAASKAAVTEYKRGAQELEKQIQNQIKIENSQIGSLVQLRAELSNVTAKYDALSKADRNSSDGLKLKDQISALSKELKEAEAETGRFNRNVGNYADCMKNAAAANIPFIGQIKSSIESVSAFGSVLGGLKTELSTVVDQYKSASVAATTLSGAEKAAAVSTNLVSTAMKILKIALISTGIGAIVVVLGSLIAYLSKTQAGTELLSKGMAAIGAIVNVFIDRLAKLGGALVKLFSGDFTGAFNDAKGALSGVGDEIARETKLAWELKEVQDQLIKQEVMLSMKRAASRKDIEKLKLIADDTTKSLKERIAAAEEAYKKEEQQAQEAINIGKQQLANMLGQKEVSKEVEDMLQMVASGAIAADEVISRLGLSESTIDDLKEFSTVFNDVAQKEAESYSKNKETQNKINSMRKEAAAKAKEAKNKERDAIREAEDAMLSLIKDSVKKQRQEINLSYDIQIEDLKEKLKTDQNLTEKAKEAINKTIQSLEQKRKNDLTKISDEEISLLIEKEQRLIELKLTSVKEGTFEELNLKRAALTEQMNLELNNSELTEQEKILIKQKYHQQEIELDNNFTNQTIQRQRDAVKLEFENRIAEALLNGQSELALKVEQKRIEMETLQRIEGESDAAFKSRQLAAQQAYVDAQQNLTNAEVQMQRSKAQALADVANGIASVIDSVGEKNKAAVIASKVLALAAVAIQQGLAIAKATSTAISSSFTVWDMAANVAVAITTVVSTMASAIKSIKGAKFASGGVFEGSGYVSGRGTGTSDSINAHLSNGESVLTAAATSMFGPILSPLNQMGGGVPINVQPVSNQAMGEDMLARAFAKGVQMMPPPVVSVKEITDVGNRIKTVESLGDM